MTDLVPATTPAVIVERDERTVRLGDVGIARENLRFNEPPDDDIPTLAATMKAAGQLQRLTVRPGRGRKEEPWMALDGRSGSPGRSGDRRRRRHGGRRRGPTGRAGASGGGREFGTTAHAAEPAGTLIDRDAFERQSTAVRATPSFGRSHYPASAVRRERRQ